MFWPDPIRVQLCVSSSVWLSTGQRIAKKKKWNIYGCCRPISGLSPEAYGLCPGNLYKGQAELILEDLQLYSGCCWDVLNTTSADLTVSVTWTTGLSQLYNWMMLCVQSSDSSSLVLLSPETWLSSWERSCFHLWKSPLDFWTIFRLFLLLLV